MTLGDLIGSLAALAPDADVRMDCGTVPTELDNDPASRGPCVATLLDDACAAVGKTFEGYKGGEFVMGRNTPVWTDQSGDYYRRAITGVAIRDGLVEIQTFVLPEEYQ
jgi:hypothetical protein